MPGIGEVMDGAMQQAPHPGRHVMILSAAIRCGSWDWVEPVSTLEQAVLAAPAQGAERELVLAGRIRYGGIP
jgi:hypothetical protein